MKDWANLKADKVMILSKHFTSGRNGSRINKVIIHHNAGVLTTEGCYRVWQTRPASAHYQVEKDGTIGQLVYDRDTAWHSANAIANRTSIGIEHSNSSTPTSRIPEATLENGAHLVAALCVYYKLGLPEWGKNVFPHSNYTKTSCPGHLYGSQKNQYIERAQAWYRYMTGAKSPAPAKPAPAKKPTQPAKPDAQKIMGAYAVTASVLNYRSGPGTNYRVNGTVKKGEVYTIVELKNGWGKLKSGAGWVSMDYLKPSNPAPKKAPAAPKKAPAAPKKAPSNTYKVTAKSGLNVRSGPGANYRRTTGVKNGEVYTIVEVKNGWGKLKSGAGWVSMDYLRKV